MIILKIKIKDIIERILFITVDMSLSWSCLHTNVGFFDNIGLIVRLIINLRNISHNSNAVNSRLTANTWQSSNEHESPRPGFRITNKRSDGWDNVDDERSLYCDWLMIE